MKLIWLGLSLLALLKGVRSQTAAESCPSGYEFLQGTRCYTIVGDGPWETPLSFFDAQLNCSAGGILAEITSAEANTFLQQQVDAQASSAFFGYDSNSQPDPADYRLTSSGLASPFSNWLNGVAPENETLRCAVLTPGDMLFQAGDCNLTMNFICEANSTTYINSPQEDFVSTVPCSSPNNISCEVAVEFVNEASDITWIRLSDNADFSTLPDASVQLSTGTAGFMILTLTVDTQLLESTPVQCRVVGPDGVTTVNGTLSATAVPPTDTNPTLGLNSTTNEAASFQCLIAFTGPTASLQLFRDGAPYASDRLQEASADTPGLLSRTFSFPNPTVLDNGLYSCEVTSSCGNASFERSVTFIPPLAIPELFLILNRDPNLRLQGNGAVVVSDPFVLLCEIGTPGEAASITEVSLLKDGVAIPAGLPGSAISITMETLNANMSVANVTFLNPVLSDAGLYTCLATQTSVATSNLQLSVVSDPPVITEPLLTESTVGCGMANVVNCSVTTSNSGVETDGGVNITWMRLSDGADLSLVNEFTVTPGIPDRDLVLVSSLRLFPQTPDNIQSVVCRAVTRQGVDTRNVTLTTEPVPPVDLDPPSLLALTGQVFEELQFDCNISVAGPLGLLVLFRDGVPYFDGRIVEVVNDGMGAFRRRFTIPSPTSLDSGFYTCEALTRCGTASFTRNITIIPLPPVPRIFTTVLRMPDEQSEASSVTLVQEDPVVFTCVVNAIGEAASITTVAWLRNNVQIPEGGQGFNFETVIIDANMTVSNLTLLNPSVSDSANYSCEAVNIGGSNSAIQDTRFMRDPPVITEPLLTLSTVSCGMANVVNCSVMTSNSGVETDGGVNITWIRISDGADLSLVDEFTVTPGIPDGDLVLTSSLRLFPQTLDNIQSVVCRAVTRQGVDTRNITLTTDMVIPVDLDPPSLLPLTGQAFEALQFDCNISVAGPLGMLLLFRDGAPYVDGRLGEIVNDDMTAFRRRFTIPSPTFLDSGLYTCEAVTRCGNASFTRNITIIPPRPSASLLNASNSVPLFQQTTFSCSIATPGEASSITSVSWLNPSGAVIPNNQGDRLTFNLQIISGNESMSRLTIRDLQLSDTGLYTCSVANTGGTASDSAFLNVFRDLPVIFSPQPAAVSSVLCGEAHSVECIVNTSSTGVAAASDANITFIRISDGVDLATVTDHSVVISSVAGETFVARGQLTVLFQTLNNIQDVQCRADTPQGSAVVNFTLATEPVVPTDTASQTSLSFPANQPASFPCAANVRPPANTRSIQLFFGGMPAPPGQFIPVLNNVGLLIESNLTIANPTFLDRGEYSCEVTTECGNASFPRTLEFVPAPPIPLVTPADINVRYFRNFTLNCTVDTPGSAASITNITWKRVTSLGAGMLGDSSLNGRLTISANQILEPDLRLASVLTLVDAVLSDAGTYVCTATNTGGNTSSESSINVIAPVINSVLTSPAELEVMTGMEATFTCLVDAAPDADFISVQWIRARDNLTLDNAESGRLTSTLRILPTVQVNNTLTISNAMLADTGLYTCVVTNPVTTVTADASLLVQTPLFLDGTSTADFVTSFTEGARGTTVLSLQHAAEFMGNFDICAVTIRLENPGGSLNSPTVEKIFPSKALLGQEVELNVVMNRFITYNSTVPINAENLLTLLRNQEYVNRADEILAGTRQVTWLLFACGRPDPVAQATTLIRIVHVNDNRPVIRLRITSAVP